MDLDDQELKATRKLHGIDKENEINKFIGMYNEIKKQSSIIGNIDKEFFFKFTDCILGEYRKQKLINNELKQKINNMDIELTTVYTKGFEDSNRKIKIDSKNADLIEKVRKLEAKLDVVNWEEKNSYECLKEKYIPKQKIIDRINYCDERIKHAKQIRDKEQEEFYIDLKRAFNKLLEEK